MKRHVVLLGLAALLVLAAPAIAGTHFDATCTGITAPPSTTDSTCTEVLTETADKISATIFAVDPVTGVSDKNLPATTSTAYLDFQECDGCPWIQYPKAGASPDAIYNVDGKGRTFKFPPHTYKVRWRIPALAVGRVTLRVRTYER